ncbi:hypothetical protein PRJ39_06060 [Lysobacter enzymogenes]|uniref:hypothetical protein n=1 Tax=Lysobacter enzymogenes TaxID=69 RepID=UPI00374A8FA5
MADPASGGTEWAGWAQMFVALLALGYAIWQGKRSAEDRRQDRRDAANDLKLRARPTLVLVWDINARDCTISVTLKNVGLGPAVLERIEYHYEGERFDILTPEVFQRIIALEGMGDARAERHTPGLATGTMMPIGEPYCLFAVSNVDRGYDFTAIAQRLKFVLHYASIYGERLTA